MSWANLNFIRVWFSWVLLKAKLDEQEEHSNEKWNEFLKELGDELFGKLIDYLLNKLSDEKLGKVLDESEY